ncbi:MAG: hypothetical protein ACFE8A_12555 [Candidatus Hodarchaeota archaeon]
MSEEKPIKPKLRGFARTIGKSIDSVKDTGECKFLIKGVKTRVLFNCLDGKWAALVTIKDGNITVEGIKNTPKENLSRKKLYWWGYFEAKLEDFLSAGGWKTGKWIRKMVGGKVKGASQIAIIAEILALAREKNAPPQPKKEE